MTEIPSPESSPKATDRIVLPERYRRKALLETMNGEDFAFFQNLEQQYGLGKRKRREAFWQT
jgi:hypothetical protein